MPLKQTLYAFGVLALLTAPVARGGQFTAVYSEVSNPLYQEWQAELIADGVLEGLAADLNAALTIPTEVVLTFAECETPNAFYNAEQQAIIICYELVDEFYQGAAEEGWSEEETEEAVENATLFFFYHELGHALVHVLDLPTTGLEEDAVDQLSTYVLYYESAEGEAPALDAALAFMAWAEEGQEAGAQLAFWDEHSLNEQRFFNLVCWVYGQDPSAFQNLVQQGYLPESRAERCSHEWQQIDKSWSALLAENLREP